MEEEVKQVETVVAEPEVDLVTKVAGYKAEEKPAEIQPEEKFNTNDLQAEIDKIADPTLKNQMEGLKKSLISGENKKYQELAETRKTLEKQMADMNLWTPDKIQRLLQDQNFVTAAQSVMGTQQKTADDSMLTEEEKAVRDKQVVLEREIMLLKQQNQQSTNAQQNENLKGKYSNYDSQAVSKLKDDLITNRVNATNEHLWKVLDYEPGLKRAYELGRKEERELKNEKVNNFAYTPDSANVVKEDKLTGEAEVTLTQLYNHNAKKQQDSQLRT